MPTRAPCRGLSLTSPMNKSMSSTLRIMMNIILVTMMIMGMMVKVVNMPIDEH